MEAATGAPELVQADVPFPVYDDWPRVFVIPTGMDLRGQVEAMREVLRERR